VTSSAETLAALAERLNGPGAAALAGLSDREILEAWEGAVAAFLDPASPERREIQAGLVRTTRLSPEGLEAGLEAVLGGMRGEPAARLLAEAAELRTEERSVRQGRTLRASSQAPVVLGSSAAPGVGCGPAAPRSNLALVILSSNLPALAVQPLLPALAARRPTLLKSPRAEPLFAPAFVRALVRRLPALEPAVAAVTWRGGDEVLEAPLLARAGVVLAYGDDETVVDLERRTAEAGGARFVAYGPKISLAAIGREAVVAGTGVSGAGGRAHALARDAVAGIARDVALFDQRGCLSIAAVYVEGSEAAARALAEALAAELGRLARELPPGPAEPAAAAAVQQLRAEADLRGLHRPRLRVGAGPGHESTPPLAAGTVIVDPEPAFRPAPGLRTVRVHPLSELGRLPEVLAPWRGRLQGVALTGVPDAAAAGRLAAALAALGVSRIAPPGELQRPDALWHNGGVSPLAALIGA
jgi:hypothetical protein